MSKSFRQNFADMNEHEIEIHKKSFKQKHNTRKTGVNNKLKNVDFVNKQVTATDEEVEFFEDVA